MTYKILKTNPRRNTHEFFIDEIEDLQILPKEPASTALVAATGDIYICTNDKEWVKLKKSCHNGGNDNDDNQLCEFVVIMMDQWTDEYYEELPCNILADNKIVNMTKHIYTFDNVDYPYFVGKCPAGEVIRYDNNVFYADTDSLLLVFNTIEDGLSSIFTTEESNDLILGDNPIHDHLNDITISLTLKNFVSFYLILGQVPNLFLEDASGSPIFSPNFGSVSINNSVRQEFPTRVFDGDIIKIYPFYTGNTSSIEHVWYKIDDGEYIEIEYIDDIGYQFTVPSEEFDKITIKIAKTQEPS